MGEQGQAMVTERLRATWSGRRRPLERWYMGEGSVHFPGDADLRWARGTLPLGRVCCDGLAAWALSLCS